MNFHIVKDPIVGEEVWLATTPQGLPIRVLPRPRFRETAAVISFRYGSTDLEFAWQGQRLSTPPGTAHYLEHKLFEDEELAVFQRHSAPPRGQPPATRSTVAISMCAATPRISMRSRTRCSPLSAFRAQRSCRAIAIRPTASRPSSLRHRPRR